MIYFDTNDDGPISDPAIAPLWSDLIDCERQLKASDTQFSRRCFVRCSFAFMEAGLVFLRDNAMKLATSDSVLRGEGIEGTLLNAITDSSFRIEPTGKVTHQMARSSFIRRVALLFRASLELRGEDAEALFSTNNWQFFQDAVKIRNRITHPRKEEDSALSESDMEEVRWALRWYFEANAAVAGIPFSK